MLNSKKSFPNIHSKQRTQTTVNFIASESRLEEQLERFWALENDSSLADDARGLSVNDKRAMSIWDNNIAFDKGHYVLPIPLKDEPTLPDNKELALKRLYSLKKRLIRDENLRTMYKSSMNDLVNKGYAGLLDSEDGEPGRIWYIPHHPVFNEKKPGKLRVVFDCASRYQGTSLNDQVLQGPDLTSILIGVLMRFRKRTSGSNCRYRGDVSPGESG